MADLKKMNEPRKLTQSGFIGCKKLKNVLALRFTSQQNMAQSCSSTGNIKLDQLMNTNILLESDNTAKNPSGPNTAHTLSAGEVSTSKSLHQIPASDDYTIFLEEIKKTQQSTQIIFDTLSQLFKAQERIQKIQDEVKQELKCIKNQNKMYESRDVLKENGINLPMKSMRKFTDYCSLLDSSSEYHQMLETSIQYTVCKRRSLMKNISSVLRKYLSPKLGSQFTAVKLAKSKTILAKTSFYRHMLNIFLEQSAAGLISNLTKAEFNKALGEVLWNAKDWKQKKIP